MRDWRTKKNVHMSYNEIWFTLKLAFRMWSEVLPRVFEEDNHSPISNVDILIGFGEGIISQVFSFSLKDVTLSSKSIFSSSSKQDR